MRARFGNYIGEGGDSEEESQHGEVPAQNYVYDEESEEEQEVNDQQLMEIDGLTLPVLQYSACDWKLTQNRAGPFERCYITRR